jgi:hypothetical protein
VQEVECQLSQTIQTIPFVSKRRRSQRQHFLSSLVVEAEAVLVAERSSRWQRQLQVLQNPQQDDLGEGASNPIHESISHFGQHLIDALQWIGPVHP